MRRFFLALGIFSIVLPALILSAELGYRTFHTHRPPDSAPIIELNDEGHFPRPYVMAVANPEVEGINTLGYKGELPALPKPDNELRIAMLGGSTVFGNYPSHEKIKGMSLPWHLEQVLNEKSGRDVRVYNFGVVSSIAIQDLVRLYQDVVHFKPDLVIYYGGGNDHSNPEKRPGYPHRFLFYEANPLWITDVAEYPMGHLLVFGSLIARHTLREYFEKYFLELAEENHFYNEDLPFTTDQLQAYVHGIDYMSRVSGAYNTRFISFAQPMRDMYHGAEGDREYIVNWFKTAQNHIAQKNPDLFHIDLYQDFKDRPKEYWTDHIHLTDPANRDMAELLTQYLKKHFPELIGQ